MITNLFHCCFCINVSLYTLQMSTDSTEEGETLKLHLIYRLDKQDKVLKINIQSVFFNLLSCVAAGHHP